MLMANLMANLDFGTLGPEQAGMLDSAVSEARKGLLTMIDKSNQSSAALELPSGGVIVVSKLGDLMKGRASAGSMLPQSGPAGPEQVAVPMPEGVDISVAVPLSLMAKLQEEDDEEVIFTAAAFATPGAAKPGADWVPGVQVMEMNRLSGPKVNVSGLPDPITFNLPANASAGLGCAYFDKATGSWSKEGVRVSQQTQAGGRLFCETVHLSLFGALLDGILNTLMCANFGLLTGEAISNLTKTAWHLRGGAGVLWGLLLLLVSTYMFAVVLDWRYAKRWSSEFLMVAVGTDDPVDEAPDSSPGGAPEESDRRKRCALFAACGICHCLFQWCRESDAVREAIDDICSNFCQCFAEARTVCESLCEAMEVDTATAARSGRVLALGHKAMSHSVTVNARRVAGASLFLSDSTVCFVLDDEDLRDYLVAAVAEKEKQIAFGSIDNNNDEVEPADVPLERVKPLTLEEAEEEDLKFTSSNSGIMRFTEDFPDKQRQAWVLLHREVCKTTMHHTRRYVDHHLFWVVANIFAHSNPVGASLCFDIFHSCKQRVLLIAADALGALALSAVFFEAGGMATKNSALLKSEDGAACGGDEETSDTATAIAMKMGRFMTVAVMSYLLAGVPVLVLESLLPGDSIRKLDERGTKSWRQYLKARRIQNRIFWAAGSSYCAFCFFFVMVFLANIGDDSDADFALAGLFALLQDFVVFPLLVSFIIPAMVAAAVTAHSLCGGDRHAFRQHVNGVTEGRGNMTLLDQGLGGTDSHPLDRDLSQRTRCVRLIPKDGFDESTDNAAGRENVHKV